MDWSAITWQQWLGVLAAWASFIVVIIVFFMGAFSLKTPKPPGLQNDVRSGGKMNVTNGESDER